MTINANVKGYINGEEWGVVETGSNLKSINQLLIIGGGDGTENPHDFSLVQNNYQVILDELNLYPQEYYSKFQQEGLIADFYNQQALIYKYYPDADRCWGIYYDNGSWLYTRLV